MNTLTNSLKSKITTYATDTLGFDDCRFTSPFTGEHLETYRQWLAEGKHGDMAYLENHLKFKQNPDLLLNGVKSAVVVIKNYKNTPIRQTSAEFKIARYAVGKDYHETLGKHLGKLADFIKSAEPSTQCFYGVDSAPMSERSLALKSGIGFLGKNSMVIKPGLGSYFFIGVVLTTLELDSDQPLSWNCGQCRLCIDACPTQAILSNRTIDAAKCISYQTIEQKTPMSSEQIEHSRGWLFGCDICQEACPYNHDGIPLTNWKEFYPQAGVGFDVFEKSELSEGSLKGTALFRSRKRLLPNIERARHYAG